MDKNKVLDISVLHADNTVARVRLNSEGRTIELPTQPYAGGIIVHIPQEYVSSLRVNRRYEMLKHRLQPSYLGLKIQTKEAPDETRKIAARARAAGPVEERVLLER